MQQPQPILFDCWRDRGRPDSTPRCPRGFY